MAGAENLGQLEEIHEDECLEILSRHSLGRVAVVVDGQPEIYPVNYAINAGIIAFQSARGSKLRHAPGSRVCFEIDGYDTATGVGWSVMVKGEGLDATDTFDDVSWAARALAPHPLAPGVRPYRIAIKPIDITGRRFQLR